MSQFLILFVDFRVCKFVSLVKVETDIFVRDYLDCNGMSYE